MKTIMLIFGCLISVNALAETASSKKDCVKCCSLSCEKPEAKRVKRTVKKEKKVEPKSTKVSKPVMKSTSEKIVREKTATQPVAGNSQMPTIIINNYNHNHNTNVIKYPSARKTKERVIKRKSREKKRTSKKIHNHSHTSVYGHGGIVTSLNNFSGEVEFRSQRVGVGLFAEYLTLTDPAYDCKIFSGSHLGLSLRYHFYPYWYTEYRHSVDPSLYAQVGYGGFRLIDDGSKFSGLTVGFGFDAAYPLSYGVKAYGRAGLQYVTRESSLYHAGGIFSLGLRFDFH